MMPRSTTLLQALLFAVMVVGALLSSSVSAQQTPRAPSFDDRFWSHWGDGQAEVFGYRLTYPRYGEKRSGALVTIFVTETFSEKARVKADPGKHPDSDTFPVMKLNRVEDFQTGVYDYNLMTSTFVTLVPRHGRSAGTPTKINFSSQEWCGHVFHRLAFKKKSIEENFFSYFDGEAAQARSLTYPDDGLTEDALLFWARGLATPVVEVGQQAKVAFLPSLAWARLRHKNLSWGRATLRREAGSTTYQAPWGATPVEIARVATDEGRQWEFVVEAAFPHRLLRWKVSTGEEATLLGGERMAYWQLNREGAESVLSKLGLNPKPQQRYFR